jgi:hypothetical protein
MERSAQEQLRRPFSYLFATNLPWSAFAIAQVLGTGFFGEVLISKRFHPAARGRSLDFDALGRRSKKGL